MTFDFLAPAYVWIKALHLISVIAWMAGLFYLPRLYIYHMQVAPEDVRSQTFKVMERRLLKAIMNPAMIATWIFGLLLILTPGVVDWKAGWWHLKFASVLAMSWFHHDLAQARKAFERDERPRTERGWRIMNEVPTVLMIIIVLMVIAKPF
ncbi:protoporphyrinogen oxidase HemJ [Roseomonas stagni]|uniref:Protoporphyrinogen IX oxidase n=1 Tax=Falsiroseomonas algicola TaxID=2716930 RepID=A0A6M1LUC9_9PROT|nr:protoporphyrinogen oxidase HemJ [Falsiroseomonas algicola]NGM23629.1 protoporphyrinogen oxidase HemJ [Falsiroseomonas algicola]